ncbi:MAG: tRNA (N(6)-L-threonylcarbamoyladenosine(37)-C(2))-methylthiotransferase [Candidatus Thorarchaeota archaeon]
MVIFNKKTYFIETYGCTANTADSLRIIRQLTENRWSSVSSPEEAEITILNTCGVKNPTEYKIIKRIKSLSKINSTKLIITGCLPAISYKKIIKAAPNFGLIFDTKSTHLFTNFIHKLEEGKTGLTYFTPSKESENKIEILPVLNSEIIGILAINEGCDGNCSFCGTKIARGNTVPFSPKKLYKQAEYFLKSGAKILWTTSQDTGAYYWHGEDFYWELPELLNFLCQLPYEFRLRLGMINPDHVLRLNDRLIDTFKENKELFYFLHIPVQSGSNRILNLMKRRYTVEEFIMIIDHYKQISPNFTLSTDIITGFPTETDEDFQQTLDLIDGICPDVLNISRYGARPGTLAAKMNGQIHERTSKERSRILTLNWQEKVTKHNKKWINWEGNVIIEEEGKRLTDDGKKTFVGRNDFYRPIIISEDNFIENPLGKVYKVRITDSSTHYLIGETLEQIIPIYLPK